MELNTAWKLITHSVYAHSPVSPERLQQEVAALDVCGVSANTAFTAWYEHSVQCSLRRDVAPRFWALFSVPVTDPVATTTVAFDALHASFAEFSKQIRRLAAAVAPPGDSDGYIARLSARLRLLLKAVVFTGGGGGGEKHFRDTLYQFYFQAFRAFHAVGVDDDDDEDLDKSDCEMSEGVNCRGCEKQKDFCCCQHILSAFHRLNKQLHELDLLDRLSAEPVTSLIHQRIKQHVDVTCKGNFESPTLTTLEQWLETKVVCWLELLYGEKSSTSSTDPSNGCFVATHRGRLQYLLYETYARARIAQLFDIIVDFPESTPALDDLSACLEKTNLRSWLISSLRNALETRLLHPGVNTAAILTAYISAIRALRVLDPTGVMLDLIYEPVRKYLRKCDDTVRCIVSSLTEDGSSELSDELIRGPPVVLDESYASDEDAGEDWESWQPDPVDADPARSAASRRSADIVSMLVKIYGSRELFVSEYRTLLAERVLAAANYRPERDLRCVELLKLRFGESQLHHCEVMLKDVADSRRINANVVERNRQKQERGEDDSQDEQIQLTALILSAQFWPPFREQKVHLPDCMNHCLERFTQSFEVLKGNRTLNWKPHLGLVDIEIELKEHTLTMSVSPVHAAILWHFQEKARWTVDELSSVTQMATAALRRKIAFWQGHGLLREDEDAPDTFILVEDHHDAAEEGGHEAIQLDEDDAESAMASSHQQKEEELQVIWSYVVGMLTNLESLPLDRIHAMLKMFAMHGPGADCSLQELKTFLDRRVKEQLLIHSAGIYRLPKSGA